MSAHLALGAVAALALAAAARTRSQGNKNKRFDAGADYVLEGAGDKAGRSIRIPAHAAGLGGTPNNENVDYLGFVAWMTPSDFLRLNPERPAQPRPESKAAWTRKGIGAPMLYVDLQDQKGKSIVDLVADIEDEPEKALAALREIVPMLRVRGHEGRGRAMFIREHLGEVLMPVAVFPGGGLRARDFARAPNFLRRAVFTDSTGLYRVPMGTFQLSGDVHEVQRQAAGSRSVHHGKRRLWVGTQRSNLASIFEKGLVPQGGPGVHRTKTMGAVFLAGSPEGAWRYADWSDSADPAIVEVDVEGLDLALDTDDVDRELSDFIREIKNISGVNVVHDAFVPEGDVDAVCDAIDQVHDSQDYALTAEVVEGEDGARFTIRPNVAISLDPWFIRLDQGDRIDLEDQVDGLYYDHRGEAHQRVEQYQHIGSIPAHRVLAAYVRADNGKPDLELLNFGRVVSGDSTHWRKQQLRQILPPAARGSMARARPLQAELQRLRDAALLVAAADTAFDASAYAAAIANGRSRMTGHCNAMAHVVQSVLGGDIVEGRVGKERHMWNRLPQGIEVDLTSDQFGGDGFAPLVQFSRIVPKRTSVNPRFRLFQDRVRAQMERR